MVKLGDTVYILLISPALCPGINTTYSWPCGKASSQKYRSRVCVAEQIGWEVMCKAEDGKGRKKIMAVLT